MSHSPTIYEPVVYIKQDIEDAPSDDELRLLLQFMPELYADMLMLTRNAEEE